MDLRKQGGITIVALVITVLLLATLAGISIIPLSGNNDILDQTATAQQQNKKSEIKETVEAKVSESYDKFGKLDMDKLKKTLEDKLKVVTETDSETGKLGFKIENYKVLISKNGEVDMQDDK